MVFIKKTWFVLLAIPVAIVGVFVSREKDNEVVTDIINAGTFGPTSAEAAHWNNQNNNRGDDGDDGGGGNGGGGGDNAGAGSGGDHA